MTALPSSVLLNYWNQICPYPAQQLYQIEGNLRLRSLSVLDGFDPVGPLKQNKEKNWKTKHLWGVMLYVHIKWCISVYSICSSHDIWKVHLLWKDKAFAYQKPPTETPTVLLLRSSSSRITNSRLRLLKVSLKCSELTYFVRNHNGSTIPAIFMYLLLL